MLHISVLFIHPWLVFINWVIAKNLYICIVLSIDSYLYTRLCKPQSNILLSHLVKYHMYIPR